IRDFHVTGVQTCALPISALYQKIGGAESNVLIGLARLSHNVAYMSQVGKDPFGKRIIKSIRAEGVDVSNVKVSSDNPTGLLFKRSEERRVGKECRCVWTK